MTKKETPPIMRLMAVKFFMTKYRRFTDIFGEADAPKEFVRSLSRNLIESVKNGPVLVKDPFYLRWLEANCKNSLLKERLHNTHEFFYISFWPERPKLYKYIKKIPRPQPLLPIDEDPTMSYAKHDIQLINSQYEYVTEWHTF